jgi:Protein of unknown function (DUF3379)
MTMDCSTFRRLKLAEPQSANPEQIKHESLCPPCTVFAKKIDAFERKLHDAAAVVVPDGFAEQILLNVDKTGKTRRLQRPYLAMAATIAVAVLASLTFYLLPDRNAVANAFAAHVASHPDELNARHFIEPAKFAAAFSEFGGVVDGSVGEVTHMKLCPILGVQAMHIVVQTEHGTATLILLPSTQASTSQPMVREGYSVTVVPLRQGSMGILTDSPERSIKVESLLRSRIRWES